MNLKSLLNRYTVDQLKEAIRLRSTYGRVEALQQKKDALLRQVAKIDRKLAKLNGGKGSAPAPKRRGRRRGFTVSAKTRRLMSLAAKRRYAGKAKADEPKPRRKWRMSAEGRQRIADAARRRWAAVKAAKEAPKAEAKA